MAYITALFILCASTLAWPQVIQPTTDVTSVALDEIGNQSSPRPLEKIDLKNQRLENSITNSMNKLGGIQMRTQGSPVISIRGSQSTTRVLVLQDDVPLNLSDGLGFNPLLIATENLGNASILKGPATSLFGHDAMAGAVGFSSRQLNGMRFFGSLGSFETSEIFAGFGKVGKTAYQLTAYQTRTAGNFPFDSSLGNAIRTRNDDETIRTTMMASGDLSPFDGAPIYWKTFHLLARQIGSTPGDINGAYASQSYFNVGHLHSLIFLVKSNTDLTVKSTSTANILEQSYNGSGSKSQSLRTGLRVEDKFGSVKLSVFDDMTFDSFNASYYTGGQSSTINESGSQIQFPVGEKLDFSAAGRIDTSTSDITPTIGIQGENQTGYQYFINYSRGTHTPSISQKYSQTSTFIGNPALKAEHSTEIDLGFSKNFDPTTVKFQAFDRTMTDLIENRTVGMALTPQNVGRAQADGFEISAIAWFGAHKVDVELAYLQSKNLDTGEALTLSPQLQGMLAITRQTPWLEVRLEDVYWGPYYDRNSASNLVSMNSWNTLNAYFIREVLDGIKVSVSFYNLLDQARQLNWGYPESQRSYKLAIEGTF